VEMQAPVSEFEPQVEQLMLELARLHQWTSMYAHGHPFLRERVEALHSLIAAQAAKEPSGVLLLGVARARSSTGTGSSRPATPWSSPSRKGCTAITWRRSGSAPRRLPTVLRLLPVPAGPAVGKIEEIPEGFLQREGIRGICISPVNYREILSAGSSDGIRWGRDGPGGDDLEGAPVGSPGEEKAGQWIAEELSEYPEILPLILRRVGGARAAQVPLRLRGSPAGSRLEGGVPADVPAPGQTLKALPEDRRKQVLESLEEGFGDGGAEYGWGKEESAPDFYSSLARSLAEGYTTPSSSSCWRGSSPWRRKAGSAYCRPSGSSRRGGT